jgi:hypothetical protein
MMKVNMPSQQRGFELSQFLLIAIMVVIVSITGLKVIPAYMEAGTIKNIFSQIAHDPDLRAATPDEIKVAFEKRASIDGVKVITPSDINISGTNGALRLSASYAVKIPMVANISLYLEFEPNSGN